MNSNELRKSFTDFFVSKKHIIVPSAPMVVKNDPTLMFTNAGMNQFKNIFLGNDEIQHTRITNSQKCLRVSGKHNDLEEVGHDTYHHTMFEMLGNWSFGDYFKKEAIDWAWEYLVNVLKIDSEKLYATVFEGSSDEGLGLDVEARGHWLRYLPESRILAGSKKDNFWEMGETGPCGPCSEIHIDLRTDEEIRELPGNALVNTGDPRVIEIWNLVFIQYNRKSDGSLEQLPLQHVDTGMGFERLCMVLQKKNSSYDTDVFRPVINRIEDISGIRYRNEDKSRQAEISKVAMRVIADHIRAIAFAIADGQMPSNTGAGYVIRRILRRAVRYGFQSLNLKEPFIFRLVPVLIHQMGDAYPELKSQKMLIEQVIKEEEASFHKTLATGLKLMDQICIRILNKKDGSNSIDGKVVFELYDTYGFPIDLTALIAKGYGLEIDEAGFKTELEKQKNRSRKASEITAGDWVIIEKDNIEEFIGYDKLEATVKISKYRKVKSKNRNLYHLVFRYTPFYAEGGGQVGDTGFMESEIEKIRIIDTRQENNLIVHITEKLPEKLDLKFKVSVDSGRRKLIAANHSATHLLHYALKTIIGPHVEQKGSLVDEHHLRFDFSHFHKLSDDEIRNIEYFVNDMIRDNFPLEEKRGIPMEDAKKEGAVALFGEKYGDLVRLIRFGMSAELCGGIHVGGTGNIGYFKIRSESAIAAGIRRIEAITGYVAEEFINTHLNQLAGIRSVVKNPDVLQGVLSLSEENSRLIKLVEKAGKDSAGNLKQNLYKSAKKIGKITLISSVVKVDNAGIIKDIAYQLKNEIEDLALVLGAEIDGKAHLAVMISDKLIKEMHLNAGEIVRAAAKEIEGGGGGQPFFATAGGKKPENILKAVEKAAELLTK
ncbi:MAG: alanine--tRNA ligase [Bacteroidota bacterium]